MTRLLTTRVDPTGQAGQTARRLRPFARRARITARPPRVFIRARKPCVRARLILDGWYVRFITMPGLSKSPRLHLVTTILVNDSFAYRQQKQVN